MLGGSDSTFAQAQNRKNNIWTLYNKCLNVVTLKQLVYLKCEHVPKIGLQTFTSIKC